MEGAFAKTSELIRNPERLNGDTIGILRRVIERYPYYQSARLLLLQNLFKMRDPMFEKELRRSAVLINDRSVLFKMVEGKNYIIEPQKNNESQTSVPNQENRMFSLIDNFLHMMPDETSKRHNNPVPVDASVDYASYLLQEEESKKGEQKKDSDDKSYFSRLSLNEKEKYEIPEEDDTPREEFFTETLAKIYIKQQKYERALEIIRVLSTDNPKKNSYFADQIRFLEKLIKINNKKKIDNV